MCFANLGDFGQALKYTEIFYSNYIIVFFCILYSTILCRTLISFIWLYVVLWCLFVSCKLFIIQFYWVIYIYITRIFLLKILYLYMISYHINIFEPIFYSDIGFFNIQFSLVLPHHMTLMSHDSEMYYCTFYLSIFSCLITLILVLKRLLQSIVLSYF